MSARQEHLLGAIEELRAARSAGSEPGGRGRLRQVFAALLLALFVVALLGVLGVGTAVCQRLVTRDEGVAEVRSSLGVIVNAVRATDAAGSVARGSGPEGDALVLVERLESGTYETRIYLADGWIVEEYALADAAYDPADATRIAESSSFDFEVEGSLLEVSCDAGAAQVALRSAGAVDGLAGGER